MRIYLKSGFDRFTGYGNDAVELAVTFNRLGADVVPFPTSVYPGIPQEFARLLEKDPTGLYDVVLAFHPPFDIRPHEFATFGRVAAGYTMWERTPMIRKDMKGHGWNKTKIRQTWWSKPADASDNPRKKNWLDVMFVTCPMNVDALRALDDGLPYAVVPCGIDPDRWPQVKHGHPDGRMRFGMCGMLVGRKDPWAAIEAWKLAKQEEPGFDAVLELKTSCPGLHPHLVNVYPDVVVHDRAWPWEKLRDWYTTIDVLVSTSRGEGNNKPAMEFMATGGTVMATDWSGHKNWLHPDVTYPLPGTLVADNYGTSDFRVDIQAVADMFLHCWKNRHEAKHKGELAAGYVRASLAWDVVGTKMLQHLGRLL